MSQVAKVIQSVTT